MTILQERRRTNFPLPQGRTIEQLRLDRSFVRDEGAQPAPAPVKVEAQQDHPLHVAMIYGEFSSAIHGPFDIAHLEDAALTGSESSFFNLARTLSERGHNVVVFCHVEEPTEHPSGFHALPISALEHLREVTPLDAVVAWNEPDYLAAAPGGVRRIVDQQLNDWGYCRNPQWRQLVDAWVFPSESSRQHHIKDEGLAEAGPHGMVIPNSCDPDLFSGTPPAREPHRVVYCSSPDRGLHHLLGCWPMVRSRVPDAELHVYYRLQPWLDRARDLPDEVGKRARFIEAALPRMASLGVVVHGPVPNREMARELQRSALLAYPCDPVRYTEGFACSVLDAIAAGCVALMSEADALPSVHKVAGLCVKGRPSDMHKEWAKVIADLLGRPVSEEWKAKMAEHAAKHSRHAIADQWERLLREGRV